MFAAQQRRFLLKRAIQCRRKGLSTAQTRKIMRAEIGALTGDSRLRCTVTHVFTG